MKIWILIFTFLIFSGCSLESEHFLSEEGSIKFNIKVDGEGFDPVICEEFSQKYSFANEKCVVSENQISISGQTYTNKLNYNIEETFFTKKHTYDLEELKFFYLDLASLIYSDEEIQAVINRNGRMPFLSKIDFYLPFSVEKSKLEFEDNKIYFPINELFEVSGTKVKAEQTKWLNVLFIIGLFLVFVGLIYSFYKYSLGLNTNTPTNTMSQEEINCKLYIEQYKTQYPKEMLFQGLVQAGIEQQKAMYYLEKYF